VLAGLDGGGLAQRDDRVAVALLAPLRPRAEVAVMDMGYDSRNTVRTDCLDWLLILGRGHLEQVLRLYVGHYNRHRPHRARGLDAPDRPGLTIACEDWRVTVRRRDLLGGLLHEYRRAA
jgi:hypothetical protein